jgi:hypothetical protein
MRLAAAQIASVSVIILALAVTPQLVATPALAAGQRSVARPECADLRQLVASERSNAACGVGASVIAAESRVERWTDWTVPHPGLPAEQAAQLASTRCTIRRVPLDEVDAARFASEFLEREPVVFTGAANRSSDFADATQKHVLLRCFGDRSIVTSTANRYSYVKEAVQLRAYVATVMVPQPLNASGAATKYVFGDHAEGMLDELLALYPKPTESLYAPRHGTSLSFGLASTGTGVPFHTHGHVFAEVLHGRKRWFFSAPGDEPRFEADASTLQWLLEVLPTYSDAERARITECTLAPGEVLYIPTHWYHATLNVGDTVFISTFV